MSKHYLVISKDGVQYFDNWNECSKHTKGVKGVKFKSFKPSQGAELVDFLNSNSSMTLSEKQKFFMKHGINIDLSLIKSTERYVVEEKDDLLNETALKTVTDEHVCLYVDGSYNEYLKNYSYGYVAVLQGNEICKDGDVGKSAEAATMRQVMGELTATVRGIRKLNTLGYKKIAVFYDYAGIEKWARGFWRAKNKFTQKYVEVMKGLDRENDIIFVKVKSHIKKADRTIHHVYNEKADQLAYHALRKEQA